MQTKIVVKLNGKIMKKFCLEDARYAEEYAKSLSFKSSKSVDAITANVEILYPLPRDFKKVIE